MLTFRHVMTAILERAQDRGEVQGDISPRIATLPTDLFRNELFLTRTPPSERTVAEIVDDVFLPLVVIQRSKACLHHSDQPLRCRTSNMVA